MGEMYEMLKAAKIVNTEGGGEPPVFIEKTVTGNGTYIASDDEADGYSKVTVDVPNTYVAGDEGKVVNNGALVPQTARANDITENGTYDTTLNNSITVNVSGDDRTLAALIDRSITSINIPSPVVNVGINAFTSCTELTSITFSSTVENISYNAFQGCTSLTSIIIPSTIKTIGNNAFQGCDSLTSITLSNGLESISNRAFYLCTALTNITIPSTVTTIGNNTFQGCTSLTSITINKPQGSISGAPWGATNATVTWTG